MLVSPGQKKASRTVDGLNDPKLGLLGRETDFGGKIAFYPY